MRFSAPLFSKPTHEHLVELMDWFGNKAELESWAGPNFYYPYTLESFTRDLKLDKLDSFSMLSQESKLLGFGQCYERLGCCHLGRLAVVPAARGQQLVYKLIEKLSDHGGQKHQTSTFSLFVLEDNFAARRAYEKYGFTVSDYPQEMPIRDCLYMLKKH